MMVRRVVIGFLSLLLTVGFLSACGEDSLEKQAQEAKEDTKRAEQTLAEAQAGLDRINTLRAQYDALQVEIANAEKGTAEYKRLIEENNKLVKQIIKEYPEMAQYVETR